jgi:hypothetical protein
MTLPSERTAAVIRTQRFLLRLALSHCDGGIKGIRSEVREEARGLLRHYPHWFDLGRKDAFCSDAAGRLAEDETPEEWRRANSQAKG